MSYYLLVAVMQYAHLSCRTYFCNSLILLYFAYDWNSVHPWAEIGVSPGKNDTFMGGALCNKK